MLLRALVVDDEPLACVRLNQLLRAEPNVEVVETCTNGDDALAALKRHRPDVVFLDVQMPEMDGFAFIEAIPPGPLPILVLATAHKKYAARAFEAHAVDFMLKPFGQDRLRQTLRRVEERIQCVRASKLPEDLSALRRLLSPSTDSMKFSERISIKKDGRILFLKLVEIDWIGAADNYVELHSGKDSHLLLSTMAALENRLPSGQFLRISRSIIVNVNRIKEIHFHRQGDGIAVLQNGTKLAFSRRNRQKLDQILGHK